MYIILYNRSWGSYKAGFGDAAGDNWIGESTLNYITKLGAPTCTRPDLEIPPEITGAVSVQLTILPTWSSYKAGFSDAAG